MSRNRVNNFYINHFSKAVVYRRKRDLIMFIVRFPFVVALGVLIFPIGVLWAVWEGLKGFVEGFLDFFCEDVLFLILAPVMSLYALIFYKKVNRSEALNE